MLHLLPEYQKRKVITEYRLRLTVVLILLLAISLLACAVFLMPSYVYLYTAKSDLVAKKEGFASLIKARDAASAEKQGGDVGNAIATLGPLPGSIQPLAYMDALVPPASSIRITGYLLSSSPSGKVSVAISGIASSREGLSSYATYLNGRFGGVKLPLSSLAKQGEIPFDFKFDADRDKLIAPVAATQ